MAVAGAIAELAQEYPGTPGYYLRQVNRQELEIQRKRLKNEEADMRRDLAGLDALPSGPVNVAALIKKLRKKRSTSACDLMILKNEILKNEETIDIFVKGGQAIQGLIRELTGTDVKRQLEAAGCMCNLSLSTRPVARHIAQMLIAYQTMNLTSPNEQLAVVSAWGLGNAFGTGPQACGFADGVGAVPRLCALAGRGGESLDAAVYALALYAVETKDDMSTEHVHMVLQATHEARAPPAMRLLFMLSCHRGFEDRDNLMENVISARIEEMMIAHRDTCGPERDCCELLFAIRALANLPRDAYARFLAVLHRDSLKELFGSLVEDERLKVAMLCFYSNAIKLPCPAADAAPAGRRASELPARRAGEDRALLADIQINQAGVDMQVDQASAAENQAGNSGSIQADAAEGCANRAAVKQSLVQLTQNAEPMLSETEEHSEPVSRQTVLDLESKALKFYNSDSEYEVPVVRPNPQALKSATVEFNLALDSVSMHLNEALLYANRNASREGEALPIDEPVARGNRRNRRAAARQRNQCRNSVNMQVNQAAANMQVNQAATNMQVNQAAANMQVNQAAANMQVNQAATNMQVNQAATNMQVHQAAANMQVNQAATNAVGFANMQINQAGGAQLAMDENDGGVPVTAEPGVQDME